MKKLGIIGIAVIILLISVLCLPIGPSIAARDIDSLIEGCVSKGFVSHPKAVASNAIALLREQSFLLKDIAAFLKEQNALLEDQIKLLRELRKELRRIEVNTDVIRIKVNAY